MKRKLLGIIILTVLLVVCGLGCIACDSNDISEIENEGQQILSIYNTYKAYAEERGEIPLSYEEWLASIKGQDGKDGKDGQDGINGKDGSNAKEIKGAEIDENGNLVITYKDGTIENLGKFTDKRPPKLKYALINDGTEYEVAGIGTCTDTEIIIPSTYNNKPVTRIGDEAFYNCTMQTSITIPDSVTSIEDDAFYGCTMQASITIPDSVTSIGESAFYNCSSLTSVTIPDSVTSIESDNFYGCSSLQYNEYDNAYYLGNDNNPYLVFVKAKSSSITSCVINSNTRFIYGDAFYNCSSLTSVTIPDSVTSIGGHAFSGCSSLTSITIPDSVTSIGSNAFYDCSSLQSVTVGNSVTSIGDRAFSGCSSLTSITIPDSVTSIGESAFYNCSKLTSVTVGNSVTSIRYSAFFGCSSLTNITIPDSVTSIGKYAFRDCRSLTSIVFNDTTSWYIESDIEVNVENASTNATYYSVIYFEYYLYKK